MPSANSSAVAATAPKPTSAAARLCQRCVVPPIAGPSPSSAAVEIGAVAKRSGGSLASAFERARSTASGTSDRLVRMEGGGATTCFAITDCGVGPAKGGSPPSISYSTQPRL